GNDDAIRAIGLYCDLMVGAVLDGIQAEMTSAGADVGESEAAPVEHLPKAEPAEAEAGAEKPAETSAAPEKPATPEAAPKKPAETSAAPEKPAEPEAAPEKPAETSAAPEKPAETGAPAEQTGEDAKDTKDAAPPAG
ncbi:MAG: hypothetical protein ACE1Y3_09280, partial [Rhodospirillales bacterium]